MMKKLNEALNKLTAKGYILIEQQASTTAGEAAWLRSLTFKNEPKKIYLERYTPGENTNEQEGFIILNVSEEQKEAILNILQGEKITAYSVKGAKNRIKMTTEATRPATKQAKNNAKTQKKTASSSAQAEPTGQANKKTEETDSFSIESTNSLDEKKSATHPQKERNLKNNQKSYRN